MCFYRMVKDERRRTMTSENNVFVQDGIKTEWDSNTITVTEMGFDHTATFDNDGNVLSSTFTDAGKPFLKKYFQKIVPMVNGLRAIDREYANA